MDTFAIQTSIGPLQDPVTWFRINYTGTQIMQWDFQNKGTLTSRARLSFVLKVPQCHLRPSVIYSIPCDQILQRVYWTLCPQRLQVKSSFSFAFHTMGLVSTYSNKTMDSQSCAQTTSPQTSQFCTILLLLCKH